MTPVGGEVGSAGTGGASGGCCTLPGGDISALWAFALSESWEAPLLQKRSLQLGGKSRFGCWVIPALPLSWETLWGREGERLECPLVPSLDKPPARFAGNVPYRLLPAAAVLVVLPCSSARAGTCVPSSKILWIYIIFFYPIKRVLGLVDLRQAVTTPDGEENQSAPGSRARKRLGSAGQGACRCGDPPCQLLIVPCQIDLSINEFAGTLLLLPVRGKGPYFKWGSGEKA